MHKVLSQAHPLVIFNPIPSAASLHSFLGGGCMLSWNFVSSGHDSLLRSPTLRSPHRQIMWVRWWRPYNFDWLSQAQRLEERAATQGFEPDLHTYSSLIKSAVRQNNLERALQLYDYMLKAAIEPSVVCASLVLKIPWAQYSALCLHDSQPWQSCRQSKLSSAIVPKVSFRIPGFSSRQMLLHCSISAVAQHIQLRVLFAMRQLRELRKRPVTIITPDAVINADFTGDQALTFWYSLTVHQLLRNWANCKAIRGPSIVLLEDNLPGKNITMFCPIDCLNTTSHSAFVGDSKYPYRWTCETRQDVRCWGFPEVSGAARSEEQCCNVQHCFEGLCEWREYSSKFPACWCMRDSQGASVGRCPTNRSWQNNSNWQESLDIDSDSLSYLLLSTPRFTYLCALVNNASTIWSIYGAKLLFLWRISHSFGNLKFCNSLFRLSEACSSWIT